MTDRELDALVAEKVMGLKCRNGLWDHGQWLTMPMHDGSCLVRWSSTGDGMLAVIEALGSKGILICLDNINDKELESIGQGVGPFKGVLYRARAWSTWKERMSKPLVTDLSAPHAVSVMALMALGVEVPT